MCIDVLVYNLMREETVCICQYELRLEIKENGKQTVLVLFVRKMFTNCRQ